MLKKTSKSITNDQLASMIARSFDKVATRDDMVEGFSDVNDRLDMIEKTMVTQFDFARLEKQVDKLNKEIAQFNTTLNVVVKTSIVNLQKRINILEDDVRLLKSAIRA